MSVSGILARFPKWNPSPMSPPDFDRALGFGASGSFGEFVRSLPVPTGGGPPCLRGATGHAAVALRLRVDALRAAGRLAIQASTSSSRQAREFGVSKMPGGKS